MKYHMWHRCCHKAKILGTTDLQVRHSQREITVGCLILLLEDALDDPGNDTHAGLLLLGGGVGSSHGEGLPRARLTIRQHCGVVTCRDSIA